MAISPGPPRPGRSAALDPTEGVKGWAADSRFALLSACRPRLLSQEFCQGEMAGKSNS
ncbi:MAG: hypothetical protein LVS60_14775 [Nodosilinea sp. LVE1205-7]